MKDDEPLALCVDSICILASCRMRCVMRQPAVWMDVPVFPMRNQARMATMSFSARLCCKISGRPPNRLANRHRCQLIAGWPAGMT